jgi:hypothetical protein
MAGSTENVTVAPDTYASDVVFCTATVITACSTPLATGYSLLELTFEMMNGSAAETAVPMMRSSPIKNIPAFARMSGTLKKIVVKPTIKDI